MSSGGAQVSVRQSLGPEALFLDLQVAFRSQTMPLETIMLSLCAICEAPITRENNSREHVILNALGGRRTVSGFICAPCNNATGHSWDAALAKQLNPFCLFFQISRQDGASPGQEFPVVAGDSIRLTPDGLELPRPKVDITTTATGATIQVVARSMAEARRILTDLNRKYPQINVEEQLTNTTEQYKHLQNPIEINVAISGHDAGRSIVKSAFSLAVAHGVAPSDCDDARKYFVDAKSACFGYFNEFDLLEGRPSKTVVHCVAVASTDDGLLLGYVELFSAFRMVVCLGSNYRGKPINAVYAIDPVSGTELDVNVKLAFSREDIADIYAYRRIPEGAIAAALDDIIPEAIRRSFEREKAATIERAIRDAWSKLDLPPGTQLTEDHIQKLSAWVAEGVVPFFLHHGRRQRNCNGEPSSASS